MRKATFAIFGALALAACDADVTQPEVEPQLAMHEADATESRTYRVTVTNLTDSQPLTPPLAFTHARPINAHKPGREASEELRQIAENGNLGPAVEQLGMMPYVSDVVVAVGDPPPLLQGGSISFLSLIHI